MKTILIATANPGKAAEYRNIFEEKGLEVKTLADLPEKYDINENGTSFEENALIKANTLMNALDLPVLADDSGLIVDALNGAPGIHSARYAGDHDDAANNQKLLQNLAGLPFEKRTARFHCTIVVVRKNHEPLSVSSEVSGHILTKAQGSDGFGYDPLFYYTPLKKSFAELTMAEKNQVSHRGLAVAKLAQVFDDWWND
ncbi:nucleoside-triphosphate diphosphatase [Ligilactobacillus salitolerans]|uniref:dITP/XTP pyrophosphatase n=1 Tax=Ligilactobacillus salitolerans TaxID=1808352 RepID=A0A401IWE3_9LACO|nr:XTP/dITP diphosphatase [Ligilactobacillus salitolerans]GBG95829.1 nucleoside-triphosphate diphosphatase [Ligilactobacillus salitolerans]